MHLDTIMQGCKGSTKGRAPGCKVDWFNNLQESFPIAFLLKMIMDPLTMNNNKTYKDTNTYHL